ncbi:hypothetical protein [Muricoccus aerilatus]|nr:hypothetical protein [Roseomonas aerilata]
MRRGFFLPPLSLTADEVDALILGLRLVTRRGGIGGRRRTTTSPDRN